MNISEDTVICRFCLKPFTENCTPIGEVVQHTLNILTLHPNLAISNSPMMCEACAANLTKYFDFKVRCLSTEDCISSFAECEGKRVNLRDIYSKVKQDGNVDGVPSDHNVCRFCLELVKDDASMSVTHDIDLIEILQKHFLEMDLNITDDLLACTPCYNYLRFYASFVNNYKNVEKRIHEYCQVEGLNYNGQVDLRDVATFVSKSLLNVEDTSSLIIKEEKPEYVVDTNVDVKVKFEDPMDVEQEEGFIKKEEQLESGNSFQHRASPSQSDGEPSTATAKSAKFTCEICGYQNNCRDHLQEHNLAHKSTVLEEVYNCEVCPYKTKNKATLRKHQLRYKHRKTDLNPDVTLGTSLKCNLCDYEAKWKSNLRRHMLIHKTPSEITMYKCEMCTYETKYKDYMPKHLLAHMGESKVEMYKCELCNCRTKYKSYLQRHMLVHMDELKIKIYKCEVCPFKTKWKNRLQTHLLVHGESLDTMFKCDLCEYEADRKCNLKRHMLIHKPPRFKCDLCDYQTRQKSTLKAHLLTHKSRSEVTMYKCDLCKYEAKRRIYLTKHMLTHKAPSNIIKYKCNLCDYEAKQESEIKDHILTHKTHSDMTIINLELLDEPEAAHTNST